MSIDGAYPPKPLVATPAYEGSPHLSPDKRWLVYQSNASGQPEIYVRRYPELDRAWPVSEGGGVQVRWSPTGREIFYRGGGQMMAVAFDGKGSEPVLGRPTALFADVYDFGQGLSIPNYDVTRDGRFLMLQRGCPGGHAAGRPQLDGGAEADAREGRRALEARHDLRTDIRGSSQALHQVEIRKLALVRFDLADGRDA